MPEAKHIAAYSILASLALPVMIFLALQVQMRYVRHEMEERLEKEQLVTVALHKDSVVWYKKNKEILVSNRMFDIKSSTHFGDSIIFSGLYDDVETDIKAKLRKLADHQNDENSASLVKKLSTYTLASPVEPVQLTELLKRSLPTVFYNLKLLLFANPFIQQASPPPRVQ